jgi:hypothetical protein
MDSSDSLLIRILLAMPGASALGASYAELRRRRRDRSAPVDTRGDVLWRCLIWGAGLALGVPLVTLIFFRSPLPSWLPGLVATAMAGGVLIAFVSAFLLGLHQGGRR